MATDNGEERRLNDRQVRKNSSKQLKGKLKLNPGQPAKDSKYLVPKIVCKRPLYDIWLGGGYGSCPTRV